MISVEFGNIDDCIQISNAIPEFEGIKYTKEQYLQRLNDVKHLILVARENKKIVGFKVGYQTKEGEFYSWMGGVLPKYRNQKIAIQLAHYQEKWCKENQINYIYMKTRNQHKAMLIFALKNNFKIVGFEEKPELEQNRILLKKIL